jgi:hypothetical protein
MIADAVLITQPSVDFRKFLGVAQEALGYSLASQSDSVRRDQHDAERFLSCLAAMHDPKAPAGLSPDLLNHVSFSVLIAADERDMFRILEVAGMQFTQADTVRRGTKLAVVSGTLAQWRDAVVVGTRDEAVVQAVFCKIMAQFESVNLNVWAGFSKKWIGNRFLLEDKRK